MTDALTTLAPFGAPMAGPPEGVVPPVGPVVVLAFVLPLGGQVPNEIQPPFPQACQAAAANVALRAQIVDQDGQPVDLSSAAQLQLWLRAPSGVALPVPASLVSNGLDGLLEYITAGNDLVQPGTWAVQAQMVYGGNVILTRWAYFNVGPNVPGFGG